MDVEWLHQAKRKPMK